MEKHELENPKNGLFSSSSLAALYNQNSKARRKLND